MGEMFPLPVELNIPEVLAAIFIFLISAQLWIYIGYYRRLAFLKPGNVSNDLPPVSIVICAKNEEKFIPLNLPLILDQDYPEYEVVVVNDCSWDNTSEVLKEFSGKYKNLKIVTIKEDEHFAHGKKFALMVGIKGAKYEHLLLTDADCKPVGRDWVKKMMTAFSPGIEIVLGYSPYNGEKGFLNKLIRLDAFFIAVQYLSLAISNKTYMGVGRNLAYTKSLFFRNRGFASHHHISSGDDDLFVNQASNRANVAICADSTAFAYSSPKTDFKEWFRQKRRHLTTTLYYRTSHQALLIILSGIPYLLHVWLLLLALFAGKYIFWALFLFVLKLLIQFIIFQALCKRMNVKDLLLILPFLEIILLFIYPAFVIANLFFKKSPWKM